MVSQERSGSSVSNRSKEIRWNARRSHSSFLGDSSVSGTVFNRAKSVQSENKPKLSCLCDYRLEKKRSPFPHRSRQLSSLLIARERNETGGGVLFPEVPSARSCPARGVLVPNKIIPCAILQSPGKRSSQIAHEPLIPLPAFLFVPPMKARYGILNFAISSALRAWVSYQEICSFKIIFRGNAKE